jgi:C-methyltransferase
MAVSPEPVFEALQAFQASAVLGTAIKLGVFEEIASGPTDAAGITAAIGADQHGLRILLDALVAIGFLAVEGGAYRLAPVTETFLLRGGPAYLGDLADVYFSDWQWQGHLALAEAVRRGGTVSDEQNVETPQHPFWETFVDAFTGASAPTAQALASILAPWTATRRPLEVLDIACGSGIYGSTVASSHDQAQVTFLDWPNVLETTRQYAERFGVADRNHYLGGDMFQAPLGGPYDLAIASHVFHHFAPDRCVALLERTAGALKPGGRIAIHDFIPTSADPAQEPVPALFSVIMLVHTRRGRSYALADYEAMLTRAGFGAPELHDIPGLPTRVIVAAVT